MSNETQTPVETGNNPSGNVEKKDVVAFETHQKLLAEKKKIQEKHDALLTELKQKQEAELTEKQEYKKLLDLREKELAETKAKAEQSKSVLENGQKLSAVLSGIQGEVERQYWGLIDTSKIAINPETGAPDELSVARYVSDFVKTYSKVISSPTSKALPNQASVTSAALTYEEWLKLPLDKQKERYAEMRAGYKK